jgi:hypothetical protein
MTLDQVKAELELTNQIIAETREAIGKMTIKLRIMEEQKKALHALHVVLRELDDVTSGCELSLIEEAMPRQVA